MSIGRESVADDNHPVIDGALADQQFARAQPGHAGCQEGRRYGAAATAAATTDRRARGTAAATGITATAATGPDRATAAGARMPDAVRGAVATLAAVPAPLLVGAAVAVQAGEPLQARAAGGSNGADAARHHPVATTVLAAVPAAGPTSCQRPRRRAHSTARATAAAGHQDARGLVLPAGPHAGRAAAAPAGRCAGAALAAPVASALAGLHAIRVRAVPTHQNAQQVAGDDREAGRNGAAGRSLDRVPAGVDRAAVATGRAVGVDVYLGDAGRDAEHV